MESALTDAKARSDIAEEFALLHLDGVGINKCVEVLAHKYHDLRLTRAKLAKLRNHPRYLQTISNAMEQKTAIVEAEVAAGQLALKSVVAKDAAFYAQCLRKMAEEGKPQAVATAVQILGLGEDSGQKQATQMTVILPGAKAPRDVTIESKKDKPDGD